MKHPYLFIPHPLCIERHRRLHSDQCKKLKHVTLEHISDYTCLLVISCPVLDPKCLRNCYLHMVDISSIPERFKDCVGKTKHKHILYSFHCNIVVYAEDLFFFEIFPEDVI